MDWLGHRGCVSVKGKMLGVRRVVGVNWKIWGVVGVDGSCGVGRPV